MAGVVGWPDAAPDRNKVRLANFAITQSFVLIQAQFKTSRRAAGSLLRETMTISNQAVTFVSAKPSPTTAGAEMCARCNGSEIRMRCAKARSRAPPCCETKKAGVDARHAHGACATSVCQEGNKKMQSRSMQDLLERKGPKAPCMFLVIFFWP